jgi:hypothetical protein
MRGAHGDQTPRPCEDTAHRVGREEELLEVAAMSTVPWRRARRRPITVLDLPCAERTVGVEAVLRLPNVMMLVVEDACTVVALTDWRRREPPRRRPRDRRRWHTEGRQLEAKKARLKGLAAQCLDAPD